jgi:hypothetical protein
MVNGIVGMKKALLGMRFQMPSKSLPLPDFDLLHSLFEVKDGILYNKVQRKMQPAGIEAGCQRGRYKWVKINSQRYSAHRVIFYMTHGYCSEYIDHIDGNGLNNKPENLRPATLSENKCNQKIYKSNTSGVKGVYWCKPKNTWVAQIAFNNRRRTLGRFKTKELAEEFIDLAREMLHGNFANKGITA